MNLSDLIIRAIIRAIIVFTIVFAVVVLRKCQQLDKCFGFYTNIVFFTVVIVYSKVFKRT